MINLRALFRVGLDFIRRNDTKIIAIGTAALSVATTAIAVKSGMKAKEEIDKAEAALPEGEELSPKDKTAIVAKAAAPAILSTAAEVGGVYLLFRTGRIKAAGALAIASFYQNKLLSRPVEVSMLADNPDMPSADTSQSQNQLIVPQRNVDTTNVPFDIFEPLSGQTIRNCTIGKLSLAEYMLNRHVEFGYKVYLDDLILFLGGHPLYPAKAKQYYWTNTVDITEYTAHMYWVDFFVSTDNQNKYTLTFSRLPKHANEYDLLDNTVS